MTLPIHAHRERIRETVQSHPVTIITAETGAGKSTQVPQYLADAGFRVLCTQPRRLAASTLAERVAEERGSELGKDVGFRTARDRQCSDRSRILFVTDGLALVRELMGARRAYDVLVVDEVHEWNINVEILVSWARREIARGAEFRLVLMSATMEAEKLAAYFDGAPIISVPGRCHPVEVRQPANVDPEIGKPSRWMRDMAADITSLSAEGKNVLAFLPGKREIAELGGMLSELPVAVVQLHGEQTRAEQRLAFQTGARKVVLATNVAQTSITIEDIDAVVDSGLVRQIEVNHGVEGLFLRPCSEKDSEQRKGRAGRTRPGTYIDHCPFLSMRQEFQTAEIQRSMLDQVVLRLLVAGIDLEGLQLFHQPEPSEVRTAKGLLAALGCVDEHGAVTELGARISHLPVGTRSGRALIEAERRGVVHRITSALAVIEAGGIVDDRRRDEQDQPIWRSHVSDTASDPISFGALFDRAERDPKSWQRLGLHGKRMREAIDIRKQLETAIRRGIRSKPRDTGSRDDAAKCLVIAEGDRLLERRTNRWGEFVWGGRKLAKESAVVGNGANARWMVGTPFDVSTRKGGTLGLLQQCTAVPVPWIRELFPSRVTERRSNARYNSDEDSCVVTCTTYLDDAILDERTEPATGEESRACLVDHIVDYITSGWGWVPSTHRDALMCAHASYERARKIELRTGVKSASLADAVQHAVGMVTRMSDVAPEALRLEFASEEGLKAALELHPDTIKVGGHECRVSYSDQRAVVTIPQDALWGDGADAVETPGGRTLELCVKVGWYSYEAPTMSALREQVEARIRDDADREFLRESDDAQELTERAYGPGGRWTGWAALGRRYRTRDEALRALHSEACNDLPYDHPLRSSQPSEEGVAAVRAEAARIRDAAAAEQAEMERNRSAVRDACGDIGDQLADSVFLFVRDCMAHREDALSVLEREADADYGRARRANSIDGRFPGVDHRRLDWKKGADIEVVCDWARAQCAPKKRRGAPRKAPQSTNTPTSSFGTLGDMLRAKGLV